MHKILLPVRDYDLDATLSSGQAFRWKKVDGIWEGIVGSRQIQLRSVAQGLEAATPQAPGSWDWLGHYLQTEVDLDSIFAQFPQDPLLSKAAKVCRGLRLLRQDPWECLASFILSSTKQIVQIRQIIASLCDQYGNPIPGAPAEQRTFPSADRLARCTERQLRACKMGFRAPYLKATAMAVSEDPDYLDQVGKVELTEARRRLVALPGVGQKIADCVLLFAYGFPQAFPIDVWVARALKKIYFKRRTPPRSKLQEFAARQFGPQAGYAQQYLFHYMRVAAPREEA